MNQSTIREILCDITYKPGWRVNLDADNRLQWEFPCPITGAIQKSRKWYVSPWATKSEVVQTALKAVLSAEEHEAREAFHYRGVACYGPHIDVDALSDAALKLDVREEIVV